MKLRFFIVFMLLSITVAYAEQTCVTDKCHSKYSKNAFIHDPVKSNDCNVCHEASENNIAKHNKKPASFKEFKYPKEVSAICLDCHDLKLTDKFLHSPVESGDCVACHNPHGGKTKYFSQYESESELCFQCHDSKEMQKTYQHGPVGAGECLVCHKPHSSNYKPMLKNDKKELCFNCHEDRKAGLINKPVVHKPLKDGGCTDCHNPHSSDAQFHLKAKSEKELCLSCHTTISQDVAKAITSSKVQHPPVRDSKCGTCHNPHSADYEKLLKTKVSEACFSCHKDMEKKVTASKYVHEPVKGNACNTCHNVHGSDNPNILVQYFPKPFYNKYTDDNYKLCFECHEAKAFSGPKTTVDTKFRNGERNLHFLHVVNKDNGRSCKACHEVHAGNQELHIRDSVPYGTSGWNLTIKYTKTKDGGSCVVGCHKPKEYNRVKPVDYR